ncbi:hypothetical protein PYW08_010041 [Mythimna loreyi]|uniref:Uncharacterized protein n=1 Tax=Mythimna loreyi TaxID=667449 RepID=A0ACC2Q5I3_9NEOP|nr:hypothetical protein PYW08_010041 [Mythimna loreyi]
MEEEPLLIDITVKKLEFLFRCAGLNIKSCKKTRMDTIKSRSIFIINFVWMNIDFVGCVVWFFKGIVNSKKFIELTFIAPCVTWCFLSTLKSLYVFLREDDVDKLIQVLKDLEINEKNQPKYPEKDAIMKFEHKFLTTVISVLNIFYFVLTVMVAISPLFVMALVYYTTNELELLLPLLAVYPFDPYDIRYWPWVYLRQVWSTIVVTIDICTTDYVFYIFCTYIRMQFRLLKYKIETFIPDDVVYGRLRNIEEVRTEFVVLVKWHQDLIRSANLLEKIYTRSTLLNFVTSSVIICLDGFNVMAISDVATMITCLSFLFTSLLQIFFLCFFGDLLMASVIFQSMEVSDAVYNCRWYLADTRLGKDLLLMQTRAQTPCKLTASNFADVNLKAFMKILSTAWSYFALLQTLYESPT